MTTRFTRLTSSNVLAQVHVNDDSRFIILPVLERAMSITGWVVYDTSNGSLVHPSGKNPEGYVRGAWTHLAEARNWVTETYYKGVS